MSQKLSDFIGSETKKLDDRRKEAFEEKGYKEFIKFDVGQTKAILKPMIPRLNTKGSYGDRRVFRVEVDKVEYDWSVSPISPLYRQMLELLKSAPCAIKVVRTGIGKATRWSVLT